MWGAERPGTPTSVETMFVKICGITCVEDALLATALGADGVGFVFAPSGRKVAAPAVEDIVRQLPHEMMTVGVFRDQGREQVVKTVNGIGLRAAQLHGHESPEDCRWVAERVPVTIRALRAGSSDLERFDEFGADILLLDSQEPGSGQEFDWTLASEIPSNRRVVLAGGLDPGNVGRAIQLLDPFGVDVSTGVEREPGLKDPRFMRAFVEAARAAVPDSLDVDQHSGQRPFNWEEGR